MQFPYSLANPKLRYKGLQINGANFLLTTIYNALFTKMWLLVCILGVSKVRVVIFH